MACSGMEALSALMYLSCVKISKGNFNQEMLHFFGDPSCKQCACNALISVYWSVVRKVSIWKSYDVGNILIEGGKIYKFLNKDDFLRAEELLRRIKICNRNIDKNTELQNFHERVAS